MNPIRFDEDGVPRCWCCGAKAFHAKRTFGAKATLGVGALLTKKKMKCLRCNKYNTVGSGQPYEGPVSSKYKDEYEREMRKRQGDL